MFILLPAMAAGLFVFAKQQYSNADFGDCFDAKAETAGVKLHSMSDRFALCAAICSKDIAFMQAVVFPEVMRYNGLKDGIEAESLRTLYVQFGKEYANFSVGLFQMKPSFAEEVERRAKQLLPAAMQQELQLEYDTNDEETIRRQRIERLLDEDWQMIYLTAFIAICDAACSYRQFSSAQEKLQWYATVYNAGFYCTDAGIEQKIREDNFYLGQQMPGKKFRYAAIAAWFYDKAVLKADTALNF